MAPPEAYGLNLCDLLKPESNPKPDTPEPSQESCSKKGDKPTSQDFYQFNWRLAFGSPAMGCARLGVLRSSIHGLRVQGLGPPTNPGL